jgi:hypothetical protein
MISLGDLLEWRFGRLVNMRAPGTTSSNADSSSADGIRRADAPSIEGFVISSRRAFVLSWVSKRRRDPIETIETPLERVEVAPFT